MRLKKHFYACLCMLLIGIGSLQAKSVTLTEAGTLTKFISDDELNTLTELTVSGPINGSDIQIIRAMGGTLKTLDLRNANIVAGGNSYYLTNYYTQDDVIGDYMFYAMTALESIVLPKDAWTIGSWYYNNNNSNFWNTDKTELRGGHPRTHNIGSGDNDFGCAAFFQCVNLKQITFPDMLIHIGGKAFGNCVKLTSINIPEGVEIIGNYAFYNCSELASVSIPSTFGNAVKTAKCDGGNTGFNYLLGTQLWNDDGFKEIFYKCSKLANITLAEGIKYLGYGMFSDNTVLTNITLPTTLERMNSAFYGCTGLTNISFPEGLKEIGSLAGCTGLTTLTIPEGVTIDDFYCNECTALTDIEFKGAVGTTIPERAFDGCTALKSINLFDAITTIENFAFRNCTALAQLTMPANLSKIGDHSFEGSGLTEVTMQRNMSLLGSYAFNGCKELTTINFSPNVTEIKEYTFNDCVKLKDITLPNGLIYIKDNAFNGCASLGKVTIPGGVQTISSGAFQNSGLTEVILKEGVMNLSNGSFDGCTLLKKVTFPASMKTISGFSNTGLKEIAFAEGAAPEAIGDFAFINCDSLSTITLPASITTIGRAAFYGCDTLKSAVLPEGITAIPGQMFYSCNNLQSVTIPQSVKEIGYEAFSYCPKLASITLPTGVATLGDNCFRGTGITSITLPEGITTLPYGALAETKLTSIKLPKSLTEIASPVNNNSFTMGYIDGNSYYRLSESVERYSDQSGAFYGCSELESVDLNSAQLNTLGNAMFNGCEKLLQINLTSTKIEEIPVKAFYNCAELQAITFPATLKNIGNEAFGSCNKIKSVDLSATSLTQISNWFSYANLQSVKLPETVTTIGDYAFENAYIKEINFPSNLATIGREALRYCQLDTLRLPDTLTEIGESAFHNAKFDCVEIPNTITKININAFCNAEIKGSLHITPNATLELGSSAFQCSGSEYIKSENGNYNRYWHLPEVHWNSTAQFPKDKFGEIDNLYLPEGGSVSNTNSIGYIFYDGITNRIDLAYSTNNNKYSFSVNTAMKAQMINYRKEFHTTSGYGEAAGWKTLVLPFDVKEISYEKDSYNEKDTIALAPFGSPALETAGTLPFWLYELGTDGNYKAATEIKAHKAYLICMPNNDKYPSENNISGYVNFSATDETNGVTLQPTAGKLIRSKGTKFDFVPTYEGVMKHDTVYALNEGSTYYGDDKNYPYGSVFVKNYNEGRFDNFPAVYPFQAYLVSNEGVATSAASAPKFYSIGGGNGNITGIPGLPVTPDKATKAYSRDGVLYIDTDADRTIRIYDVTGRTVRIVEAREGVNEVHGLESGIYLLEGQKVAVGR